MITLVVCLALGANPIPPPRTPRRPPIAGEWIALWNGQSDWITTLSDNGAYLADRPAGPRYEGRYTLKGDVLTIEEHHAGPTNDGTAPHVYRYTFTLAPGKLDSVCGKFRLRQRPRLP